MYDIYSVYLTGFYTQHTHLYTVQRVCNIYKFRIWAFACLLKFICDPTSILVEVHGHW